MRFPTRDPMLRRRFRPPAAALAAALALGASACDLGPPEAPYVAPAPGTVYDYGDFTNTIVSSDGWRVRYSDDRGREGERVGLFLTGDVVEPLQVDPAVLDSLWPLRPGHETAFQVRRGPEVWRWELRVLPVEEEVNVGAGRYRTIVVQGVQTPELVRSPRAASTVMHSWWYAPEAKTVVRFRTTYLAGPGQGRVVEGALRGITSGGPAPAETPAAGRVDSTGRAGGAGA